MVRVLPMRYSQDEHPAAGLGVDNSVMTNSESKQLGETVGQCHAPVRISSERLFYLAQNANALFRVKTAQVLRNAGLKLNP